MLRLTLEGVLARKFRLVLTATAVILGVAFMAGTLIFTATLDHAFASMFDSTYGETDAVVRSREAFESDFGDQRERIDVALLDRVRRVDGVRAADVEIEGYAQLVDRNGDAMGNPTAGAATLGGNWVDEPRLTPWRLEPGGRPPAAADEIVIDRKSAEDGDLRVGDEVTVLTRALPARYRVVGVARWGDVDSPLGGSMVKFTAGTAQEVVGDPGKANLMLIAADERVSQAELVQRVERALADPTLEVLTGDAFVEEGQSEIRKSLSFFNRFLIVFALISLVVGSFIIFNTFSIVVAQRVHEMALLRAIGATRTQVLASIMTESVVLAGVASALGLVAGIGLAMGLRVLLGTMGLDLPGTSLQVTPDAMLKSFAAGCVVTIVSAVLPARRASAVPPLAAMREVAVDQDAHRVARAVLGGALALVGLAGLAIGVYGNLDNPLVPVGVGVGFVFGGVAVSSSLFARPVTRFLGAPVIRLRGTTGQLARENAMRNPSRTSATASALMIGVALVSLITIIASSAKASIDAVVERSMRADYVVTAGGFGWSGFSPELSQRLAVLPEVDAATGVRLGPAQIDGDSQVVMAADPKGIDRLWDLGVADGTIATLSDSGVAISRRVADDNRWGVGDRIAMTFARTGVDTFVVEAVYDAREAIGDYVINLNAYNRNFVQPLDMQVWVKLVDGVGVGRARAAIERALEPYPNVKLLDQNEYRATYAEALDQMLNLVYALLALAIVIALIGIANTLALSIHERTRELGLLRAVGLTRGQLRSMIRWEAVMISMLGAFLGIVIGCLFGWALARALKSEGIDRLVVPASELAVVVVLAWVAGVVAALRPGQRAARIDVLRAITTE